MMSPFKALLKLDYVHQKLFPGGDSMISCCFFWIPYFYRKAPQPCWGEPLENHWALAIFGTWLQWQFEVLIPVWEDTYVCMTIMTNTYFGSCFSLNQAINIWRPKHEPAVFRMILRCCSRSFVWSLFRLKESTNSIALEVRMMRIPSELLPPSCIAVAWKTNSKKSCSKIAAHFFGWNLLESRFSDAFSFVIITLALASAHDECTNETWR